MSDNSTFNATAAAQAAELAAANLTNARYMFAQVTIQILSYGIYLPVALMGIEILLRRRRQQKLTLYYSCFMLALTTVWFVLTNIANEVVTVEVPYNNVDAGSEGCATTNVVASALSTMQFLFSDLLLLYRAYIIWDRSLPIIALPTLSWISFLVCTILANMSCKYATLNYTPIFLAYFAFSVITNSLCSILIAVRIVLHRRQIRGAGIAADHDYGFLARTMAESGAWYCIVGIINIALYVAVPDNMFGQITNTLFGCMAFLTQAHVILRVALGVDYKAVAGVHDGPGAKSTAMAFNSAFGRGTEETGSSADADTSGVWDGEKERDAESGSLSSGRVRTIPSANRL